LNPRNAGPSSGALAHSFSAFVFKEINMPAILLWLLGVPIPVIILLVLLWH